MCMSGRYNRNVTLAAALVLVLNLADAVFTLMYVGSGMATEANPLMDQAFHGGPLLFMVVKLALVSAGVMLLWRLRQRKTAVVAIAATAMAYSFICFYHLSEAHRLVAAIT